MCEEEEDTQSSAVGIADKALSIQTDISTFAASSSKHGTTPAGQPTSRGSGIKNQSKSSPSTEAREFLPCFFLPYLPVPSLNTIPPALSLMAITICLKSL